MFTHSVFWLWFAGVIYLAAGLIVIRLSVTGKDPTRPFPPTEKPIVLGPVFVAAAMAVFGAEHFVDAHDIAQIVPSFLPMHLFVAYFVGCAWFAAATSLVSKLFIRLSAALLGLAFFLFVLMMDLPFAATHPKDWLAWTLALRESAFAGGAWALSGSLSRSTTSPKAKWMVAFGRFALAFAAIVFGLVQILHPQLAPGVPDTKLTPDWVPLHAWWGYPVGALLLVAGLGLLLNKRPRAAAISIGALMTFLTLFLYLPILAVTLDPALMTDAINFVFDTLLFAGTALLVAGALPASSG